MMENKHCTSPRVGMDIDSDLKNQIYSDSKELESITTIQFNLTQYNIDMVQY